MITTVHTEKNHASVTVHFECDAKNTQELLRAIAIALDGKVRERAST